MSGKSKRFLENLAKRSGPIPKSFTFGDGIDWASPLIATRLYVELPFWLMIPPGPVQLQWSSVSFTVSVCPDWVEVFGGYISDSRSTSLHHGPTQPGDAKPSREVAFQLQQLKVPTLPRLCKTVLRMDTRAHASAFRKIDDEKEPPRARVEQEAYWASLCEAHIPVVNELIQRYRLSTYDFFAYEVSAWDVPIWYLKQSNCGFRALLVPYKGWDHKPVIIEDGQEPDDPPNVRVFEWTKTADLSMVTTGNATPGEFDLLDARSLMERGDYTGAVRRTVTAVEAVVGWAFHCELLKSLQPQDAAARLRKTVNNFPLRLGQWRHLANPPIDQGEFDEFESTRRIRHEIVHAGRRLTHQERGRAQRAVDTSRWLFNKIEGKPERARLRDYGVLKSAGRVALAPRFPVSLGPEGFTLRPIQSIRPG